MRGPSHPQTPRRQLRAGHLCSCRRSRMTRFGLAPDRDPLCSLPKHSECCQPVCTLPHPCLLEEVRSRLCSVGDLSFFCARFCQPVHAEDHCLQPLTTAADECSAHCSSTSCTCLRQSLCETHTSGLWDCQAWLLASHNLLLTPGSASRYRHIFAKAPATSRCMASNAGREERK